MKKNSTSPKSPKQAKKESRKACKGPITIGMDLGDKTSRYCMLDNEEAATVKERNVPSGTSPFSHCFRNTSTHRHRFHSP
jgi:DNA transposition AAA+ family ATPase